MPTQKLLPLVSGSKDDPSPIGFNLKIPTDIQQKLINSGSKLRIVVSKGEVRLMIDGIPYKLNKFQEFSRVDLYKQFSNSTFKSIGSLNSKLTISHPTNTNTATNNTSHNNEVSKSSSSSIQQTANTAPLPQKSFTPPLHSHSRNRSNGSNTLLASGTKISAITKKLIHLLALGPITLEGMIQRTKLTKNDIDSVLRSISMEYSPQSQKIIQKYPIEPKINIQKGEKLYVLNYSNYKDLKLNDWKYPENELEQLKRNCKLVFDHLNYPNSHPARLSLNGKSKREISPSSSTSGDDKKSISPKEEAKSKRERSPLSDNEKVITKKTSPPIDNQKKRKREDSDKEYLKNLAERFKLKYKEYETLYKKLTISKQSQKQSLELKKLYEMHKDLELWKKQLWQSVNEKSTNSS